MEQVAAWGPAKGLSRHHPVLWLVKCHHVGELQGKQASPGVTERPGHCPPPPQLAETGMELTPLHTWAGRACKLGTPSPHRLPPFSRSLQKG